MTTKKERRAKVAAKREAMMEELRESGLKAQKQDRARRERQRKQTEATVKEYFNG